MEKNQLKIIDAHTHVQFPDYDKDRSEVIKRCLDNGIGMINAGADLESTQKGIDLANQFDYGIWATAGLHPTDAVKDADNFSEIEKLAENSKVVGIGECGFDLYREKGDEVIKIQKELFEKHILLSNKIKKPLVIHSREAFPQTFEALEKNKDLLLKNAGIFHFFTGGIEEAKKAIELGFSFTFGGLITYKNDFDEVVKYIPLENILIETDAPFIPTKSHRKERSEPSFVVEVLNSILSLKNIELKEAEKTILANTKRIFDL